MRAHNALLLAAEDIDRAAVTIRLGHVRIIIYKYAFEVWLSLVFLATQFFFRGRTNENPIKYRKMRSFSS